MSILKSPADLAPFAYIRPGKCHVELVGKHIFLVLGYSYGLERPVVVTILMYDNSRMHRLPPG